MEDFEFASVNKVQTENPIEETEQFAQMDLKKIGTMQIPHKDGISEFSTEC